MNVMTEKTNIDKQKSEVVPALPTLKYVRGNKLNKEDSQITVHQTTTKCINSI